ncbi:MAG: hypothetical protein GF317_05840 [Candidatus Lokiarchaeota archaeon]|nr:hypothetical protein [Candidatus Lokiarchaeota archaeon]
MRRINLFKVVLLLTMGLSGVILGLVPIISYSYHMTWSYALPTFSCVFITMLYTILVIFIPLLGIILAFVFAFGIYPNLIIFLVLPVPEVITLTITILFMVIGSILNLWWTMIFGKLIRNWMNEEQTKNLSYKVTMPK